MREYVQFVTSGDVITITESLEESKQDPCAIKCPWKGCTKTISWKIIEESFGTDFALIKENAEQKKIKSMPIAQPSPVQGLIMQAESIIVSNPNKMPGKCYVVGCTSKPNQLSRLKKCSVTCPMFVCKEHQKMLFVEFEAKKIGSKYICFKCGSTVTSSDIGQLSDGELEPIEDGNF